MISPQLGHFCQRPSGSSRFFSLPEKRGLSNMPMGSVSAMRAPSATRDGDDSHGGRARLLQDARAFLHRRAGGKNVVHENKVTA